MPELYPFQTGRFNRDIRVVLVMVHLDQDGTQTYEAQFSDGETIGTEVQIYPDGSMQVVNVNELDR